MECSDKFYEFFISDTENKLLKTLNEILLTNFEDLRRKIMEDTDYIGDKNNDKNVLNFKTEKKFEFNLDITCKILRFF